jgi:hypothetical protein
MEFTMENTERAISEQFQASTLWTFVHSQTPLFPHTAALDVVQNISPQPGDDIKGLAKRLRKGLVAHRVKLSHTAALDAAAKLLGFKNWFSAADETKSLPRLRVQTGLMSTPQEALFSDWDATKSFLCEVCEARQATTGASIFEVKLGKAYLGISTPVTEAGETGPQVYSEPLLVVSSLVADVSWLEGAKRVIEALRRRLEETGKATVDGAAVVMLCENMTDALYSELIVMQSEHELDIGFEVARGDELECWAQMELACKSAGEDAGLDVETGAWQMGGRRLTWEFATIRPDEYIPGLRVTALNQEASAKLFRRYKQAKRRRPDAFSVRQAAKPLESLGEPAERYRVNLHHLLLEMNRNGLTWESYCEQTGEELAMEPMLPTGFLLKLIDRLQLADPNAVFAWPSRSELALAADDKMLRVLLPRVSHVRYRLVRGLDSEIKNSVKEALEELSSSLMVRQMTRAPVASERENLLPHLVYASDGEDLLGALSEHGLVAYVGVVPRLVPTDVFKDVVNSVPFAFGFSLFLDIDFEGSTA